MRWGWGGRGVERGGGVGDTLKCGGGGGGGGVVCGVFSYDLLNFTPDMSKEIGMGC